MDLIIEREITNIKIEQIAELPDLFLEKITVDQFPTIGEQVGKWLVSSIPGGIFDNAIKYLVREKFIHVNESGDITSL